MILKVLPFCEKNIIFQMDPPDSVITVIVTIRDNVDHMRDGQYSRIRDEEKGRREIQGSCKTPQKRKDPPNGDTAPSKTKP